MILPRLDLDQILVGIGKDEFGVFAEKASCTALLALACHTRHGESEIYAPVLKGDDLRNGQDLNIILQSHRLD